jgi:hypothetical protein
MEENWVYVGSGGRIDIREIRERSIGSKGNEIKEIVGV